MLAVASAWDALADELFRAAAGYQAVLSELTSRWLGPTSLSMAAAVTPHAAWLHSTAMVVEQTAIQARAAAAAYEQAFAMVVPPPVITANRALLLTLIATNFFGQNTPAIVATEAQYDAMWAQDAAAMYGYAASSATAADLTPFTEPPPATNPAGPPAQPAAPAQLSPLAAALQQLTTPTAAASPLSASTMMITSFAATKVVNTVMSTTSSAVSGRGILIVNERIRAGGIAEEEEDGVPFLSMAFSPAPPTTTTVSARIGQAAPVGKLSVPAGWVSAAPQLQPTALALPTAGTGPAEVPADLPVASGGVFSQSVLGTLSRDGPDRSRPRSKPIIVRSPTAGQRITNT